MALWSASPAAASSLDLISGDSLTLSGDLRLVGANGERSWVDGGFGKLSAGGAQKSDDWQVEPALGEANLVWQPRFGWTLSGTVVATMNGGEDVEAGISQAFLAYQPQADRQGSPVGPGRPDVGADLARTCGCGLACPGHDHAIGDQQLDRRGSTPSVVRGNR